MTVDPASTITPDVPCSGRTTRSAENSQRGCCFPKVNRESPARDEGIAPNPTRDSYLKVDGFWPMRLKLFSTKSYSGYERPDRETTPGYDGFIALQVTRIDLTDDDTE